MGIEKEHGETVREPMEQSPAIIKGQEIEVFRRGSFYYLKGSNEAYSSRYYAEQAYRENLVAKEKPKMDIAIKKERKAAALGLISENQLKKKEKEQKEWLEKQ